jgi:hypothetical protein
LSDKQSAFVEHAETVEGRTSLTKVLCKVRKAKKGRQKLNIQSGVYDKHSEQARRDEEQASQVGDSSLGKYIALFPIIVTRRGIVEIVVLLNIFWKQQ